MLAALTLNGSKAGLELLASLLIGLAVREYVRARVTAAFGDATPRLWGRLTLQPRQWFDPVGSGILPALIAVLWAAGGPFLPPFAYAKPAALEPNVFRDRTKDLVLVSVAGPIANVALALIPGLLLRAGLSGELGQAAALFLTANVSLAVFHLMPIPGLDGARIVARLLPDRARVVFVNLDQYLVLFVLVVFFIFAGPMFAIVRGLTNGVCSILVGVDCV